MSNTNYVDTIVYAGVTSAAPKTVFDIPVGSAIRIYPTSAGTATVYSSGSTRKQVEADDTSAKITGNTNAQWSQWGAGAVTATTVQAATISQTAVSLVVTSGTWTIEVCR